MINPFTSSPITGLVDSYMSGRKAKKDKAANDMLKQLMGKAMSGDENAMSELIATNPQAAMQLQAHQVKMTPKPVKAEAQKTMKDAQKFFSDSINQMAYVPEENKASFYQTIVDDMNTYFPNAAPNMPQEYDESVASRVGAIQPDSKSMFGESVLGQAATILSDPKNEGTREYELAKSIYARPQTITAADGSVVSYTPKMPDFLNVQGSDKGGKGGESGIKEITPGKDRKYTESEQKSFGFSGRMLGATSLIDELESNGYRSTLSTKLTEKIPFDLGKFLQDPNEQAYLQAAEDWIRAKLRKESGAVIGTEEGNREYLTFFPRPGESPEMVEQKRLAREVATKGFIESSGRGEDEIRAKLLNSSPSTEKKDEAGDVVGEISFDEDLESKAPAESKYVVQDHPEYGNVTESDIEFTMKQHNLTREQVMQRMGVE